jgi:mycothiol synthase
VAELTTRGYTHADAGAVKDLFNLVDEHAGGHPGWMDEDIEVMIDTMIGDPATDTQLRVAPNGRLVAAGLVPAVPPGGFRVDLHGGVHPAWRGQGIGREVLDWQLTRAAELHAVTAPEARWSVQCGAIVGDEQSLRLFRRFGLAADHYWLEMAADLSDVPNVPVPDGFRLVRYDPGHERAFYAAHMEAFRDHYGYQQRGFDEYLAMSVRASSFLPGLSLLALDGDEIAGYVLSYRDGDPDRLYVGQVGVRRPWRKRGLAGGLLVEVLRLAAAAGLKTAALGVDATSPTGAVGVYERAGFTVEHRAVSYAREIEPR